jgi:hypothetical protein
LFCFKLSGNTFLCIFYHLFLVVWSMVSLYSTRRLWAVLRVKHLCCIPPRFLHVLSIHQSDARVSTQKFMLNLYHEKSLTSLTISFYRVSFIHTLYFCTFI